MVGGNFLAVFVDVGVAVVGHVVFGVTVASMAYFDVGSVGVGRAEVGNVDHASG